MPSLGCSDLAAFGLPLFTPESPEFIEFAPPADSLSNCAALLVNNSGKTVLAMTTIWRRTYSDGRGAGTATYTALASSAEYDILTGRKPIPESPPPNVILAGSKRLFTQTQIYGDNSDVLGAPPVTEKESCGFSFGCWSFPEDAAEISHVQFELDSVFFEDGLCIGPDRAGTLDGLTSGLAARRQLAQALMDDLAAGVPLEAIIQSPRPYTRSDAPPRSPQHRRVQLVRSFAHWAIHQIKHLDASELASWIASFSEPPQRIFRSAHCR